MDGQIRFQAKMKYGAEALMALQLAAGKTTRRKYVGLRRGFDFVVSGLMLADGAVMLLQRDYGVLTWLMLAVGLVFLGFGTFYYQLSVFRIMKSMPKEELDRERLVSFSDAKAQCIVGQDETRFQYGSFKSLYEWQHFLLLFVDDKQALLVDEEALTLGTAPELREFLEQRTGMTVQKIH